MNMLIVVVALTFLIEYSNNRICMLFFGYTVAAELVTTFIIF